MLLRFNGAADFSAEELLGFDALVLDRLLASMGPLISQRKNTTDQVRGVTSPSASMEPPPFSGGNYQSNYANAMGA